MTPQHITKPCAILFNVPGAMAPGEFEERLKGVLKEVTGGERQYVLFIDDIHNVTGPNAQQVRAGRCLADMVLRAACLSCVWVCSL